MRVIIYPYKMRSKSAGLLAEGLRNQGIRCFKVYPDRAYTPRNSDIIINWGNSMPPMWYDELETVHQMVNKECHVREATNKLTAFEIMKEAGVSIPEFTNDEQKAQQWYLDGYKVVGRDKLSGKCGQGILITDNFDYPVSEGGMDVIHMREIKHRALPLYVKYIKKTYEYRIHVFKDRVIDIQQKRKKRGYDEINHQIRTHNNGWVFTRMDVNPNQLVISESIKAVQSLGLDFGAVDVIWNNHYAKAYVLEVNTAPGLEGTTVDKYINAIKEYTDAI